MALSSMNEHWAGQALAKAESHFSAVDQTVGFDLRRSKSRYPSMGID
jgi:hypothetical protein